MENVLIVSRGLDIASASKKQVANLRNSLEQLSRDPRVKTIYGFSNVSNQGAGWAALCECANRHEAERIAAMAEVSGQTQVEIIQLLPAEQLRLGLEEIERTAAAVPQAFSQAFPGQNQE